MGKRILYMSCHEILEYDELKLFTELGHEVYSLGAYTQPGGEENRKRPPLKLPYNPHFIELSLQYDRRKLHPEMLEGIDIVIVMHDPSYLGYVGNHNWHPDLGDGNWPLFREFIKKGGRVIWRSIGQSIPHVERKLRPWRDEGLEVVRYSPAEQTIPDNVGTDAVIRFYKDPDEYKGWNGNDRHVINFTQSLKDRADFTGYDLMRQVFRDKPAKVFGPNNDNLDNLNGGLLKHDEQIRTMQKARAYLYHGTYPASYTLSFIEAMMVGVPMICVGPNNGNSFSMFPNQSTYEIPSIIKNGINGFISDNTDELRVYVDNMLDDYRSAKSISIFGRQTAIELFGKSKIKAQWKEYLS